ncbi:PRC-barrel domain protein [Planctomycetes bacterium Poly30]|uniref:PRC-barrel domain protein n=1 Tax=Saltatorellus ferox TaxID=2528018 RepID=A0A518EX13_9BACT|nr:PRC-barrel domain protein [Planctomycetes bacterium Poly30]
MSLTSSIALTSLSLALSTAASAQSGIGETALGSTNFLTDAQLTAMELSTRMGEQLRQYAPIGQIADLIVDGTTGEITYLVIEEEIPLAGMNPQRIIPWDKLIWRNDPDGEGKIVEILMTEEEFLGLPSFVAAESELLTTARRQREGDVAPPVSHSSDKKEEKEEPHPMYLTSSLTELDVFPAGGAAPLSAIESAVFDLDEGRLAFFTMDIAGKSYLVPLETLSFDEGKKAEDATGHEELVAFVPFEESELGDGPTLADEDRRNARNPKFREESIRFFDQWKKDDGQKKARAKDKGEGERKGAEKPDGK